MKIDMHCHSYYSNDGVSSPEKLAGKAAEHDLDGFALTDHNTTKGWNEGKTAADRLGLIFIPGEEIKIKKDGKNVGEILAYFLQEEVNPKDKTIDEVIEEVQSQGGIAIIAHPYHWKKPFIELEKYKNKVNGIEGFNSRSQTKRGNKKSFEFCQKNNIPMTAGSDCHSAAEIGSAYIEVDAEDNQNLKESIVKGRTKIYGRQSPLRAQLFATIGKTIHLVWTPK